MSFGGTYNLNDGYGFSYARSLLNYAYNTHNSDNTWRVNARFTQRFPVAQDSKSFIKNVNYSIGVDYSRTNSKSEDADLKNNPFQYGYIGKFNTHTIRAYTPTSTYDTVSHKYAFIQNGTRDTAVTYTPFNYNPESANWTSQYYDFFNKFGYYENMAEIVQNRGLINGMSPYAIYNTWENVGTRDGGYGKSQSDQFSINASFAADLGNHEIQLGFQYQQRSSSSWYVSGIGLWSLMRGLTNAHLKDLDLQHPQLVYRDGNFVDTINYFKKYVPLLQTNFDVNLRKKLGLPIDGTDIINIDSYDMNANTISYYDQNQVMHTATSSGPIFSLDMFSADELLGGGANLIGNPPGYPGGYYG
jgi:hypothetical protein